MGLLATSAASMRAYTCTSGPEAQVGEDPIAERGHRRALRVLEAEAIRVQEDDPRVDGGAVLRRHRARFRERVAAAVRLVLERLHPSPAQRRGSGRKKTRPPGWWRSRAAGLWG